MEGQTYRWIEEASPTTPLESLALLAEDVSTAIRMAVARNRATPPEALELLKYDANASVRLEAERNLSTLTKTAMP